MVSNNNALPLYGGWVLFTIVCKCCSQKLILKITSSKKAKKTRERVMFVSVLESVCVSVCERERKKERKKE